jgi:hypothetical protein
MSLGEWGESIANGDPEIEEILTDVPGPMCPKIDAAKGGRWSRPTTLARENRYDTIGELYSDAESIEGERDDAFNGLEECRTAIGSMRDALVLACERLTEANDKIARLTVELEEYKGGAV